MTEYLNFTFNILYGCKLKMLRSSLKKYSISTVLPTLHIGLHGSVLAILILNKIKLDFFLKEDLLNYL